VKSCSGITASQELQGLLYSQTYFVGAGVVDVAVEVTVDVTDDDVAGAEYPTATKTITIARTAMIIEIFFIFHPPFFLS
jgi:hypothetical protein